MPWSMLNFICIALRDVHPGSPMMLHPCFCRNQGVEGGPDLRLMALQSALILATLASLIDENLGTHALMHKHFCALLFSLSLSSSSSSSSSLLWWWWSWWSPRRGRGRGSFCHSGRCRGRRARGREWSWWSSWWSLRSSRSLSLSPLPGF